MSPLVSILAGALFFAAGMALGWWMRSTWTEPHPERTLPTDNGTADVDRRESRDEDLGDELFAGPEAPRAALRTLAEEVDDVHDVYLEAGFSPLIEDRVTRLRHELRDRIVVEIPDPHAFREALETARTKMDRLAETDEAGEKMVDSVRRAARLLDEVWELRDEPATLRERLEVHPVDEQLPFIERVPVTQSGAVRWRTPVRVSVLRKQPADEGPYRRLLDRLSALVENSELPRPDRAVDEVRTAVGRLQRDLDAEDAYVPTLLRRVDDAVDAWLYEALPPNVEAKKDELETFLLDLLTLRDASATLLETTGPHEREHPASEQFRDEVREQARRYTETDWLQVRWLTDAVLANLLAGEVLRVRHDPDASSAFARTLETVQQEIRARDDDPVESMRRLRASESDGCFVHSLVFSLLRMRAGTRPSASV